MFPQARLSADDSAPTWKLYKEWSEGLAYLDWSNGGDTKLLHEQFSEEDQQQFDYDNREQELRAQSSSGSSSLSLVAQSPASYRADFAEDWGRGQKLTKRRDDLDDLEDG